MTSLLELLIYESMLACGMDATKATQAARKAAGDVRKAIPHVAESEDRAERDRRIYELRATMTESQLAGRFGISIRRVQQIVKDQHEQRPKIA